ncbi:MAG TPA: universal stress protein [Pirellulales bacterium]|nr:universal stress protein [Pirellulales bacterium]
MNEPTQLFRKILVATDFSQCAAAALAQAAELARLSQAELTLAHAIPVTRETMEEFVANPWYAAANVDEIEQRLQHGTDEKLQAAIEPYKAAGAAIDVKTLWGTPFLEVIHLVQEEGYDLVVVGTRGHSPVSRFLTGSTATKLVRKCPCPVWVAQPRTQARLGSILAPVDLTGVSRKSLRMAALLAQASQSALHALHVYVDDRDVHLPPLALDFEVDEALRRRQVRRKALDQFAQFVGSLGLPVQPTLHLERGEPWKRILACGRRVDADLTVMGTVGRSGVSGLLIGNTAEKVLHSAARSLLAVKPDSFVSPVQPRTAALHAY